MSIGALDAAKAYGRAMGNLTSGIGAGGIGAGSIGDGLKSGGVTGEDTSFGAMLSNMVSDTSAALKGAEQASIKQVAGKGDLIDVVTAIGAAEQVLDTFVAVRDKVVNAYGEIMRMQV